MIPEGAIRASLAMLVSGVHYKTVEMHGGCVRLIEQRLLPHQFTRVDCTNHRETAEAIREMVVRGAGAIGVTAGYGAAQAAIEAADATFAADFEAGVAVLRATRPTAQNLFYALDRVAAAVRSAPSPATARRAARETADAIAREDEAAGRAIGEHGAALIPDGARILTHCNAGWLAFSDWGSALSPIYMARRQGKNVFVFADETRPACQGSRLTAWELSQEQVPFAVIADNAAGYFLRRGEIDLVIVGADRIAANGDVANKVGTYEKAVCAKAHGVPFYVAAPTSTIDPNCPHGDAIPIEERADDEVLSATGLAPGGEIVTVRIAAAGAAARNPVFDVTPADLIAGIITQRGVFPSSQISRAMKTS